MIIQRKPNKEPIRITVDIESISGEDLNFKRTLQPLISVLDDANVKATFFIVGSEVSKLKTEIRQLVVSGHEIAMHGHTHQFLKQLGPTKFESELKDGRDAIEEVTGTELLGFRAPYFSLTKESAWAPEILCAAGFKYSSSVLPAVNPQAGYPKAPRVPFRWKCGLVEFPVPTFGLGRIRLPLLGGAYLRISPKIVYSVARSLASRRDGEWVYCHPYDFDVDAEFEIIRGTSRTFSKLLFARRNLMLPRVSDLVSMGRSKSFEERIENKKFLATLQKFDGVRAT
jgi:polysaccharide deacetylase family protein (PEP-CTERM system associated)